MSVYFNKLNEQGKGAEAIVAKYLSSKGWDVSFGTPKINHYDIKATKDGVERIVEVKLYGAPKYKTVFAERVQISPKAKLESIPEYIQYASDIDYIVYVDMINGAIYFYHNSLFSTYALACPNVISISAGTAKGVRIPETSILAGFCKKVTFHAI